MSIKPIDLQTNIGQMHEVGKNEHLRSGALVGQQQVLEKESNEKSRLIKSRLDETKKADRNAIRDEEKKREHGTEHESRENPAKEEQTKKKSLKDDRMGNIIDILK